MEKLQRSLKLKFAKMKDDGMSEEEIRYVETGV